MEGDHNERNREELSQFFRMSCRCPILKAIRDETKRQVLKMAQQYRGDLSLAKICAWLLKNERFRRADLDWSDVGLIVGDEDTAEPLVGRAWPSPLYMDVVSLVLNVPDIESFLSGDSVKGLAVIEVQMEEVLRLFASKDQLQLKVPATDPKLVRDKVEDMRLQALGTALRKYCLFFTCSLPCRIIIFIF